MATAIVKSVGATARDYATPQLFEDDVPADITSTDETWTGETYNDAEFTGGTTFSGITTDATRWVKLTTASGESFMDDADKLTNALAYDQANGVGIKPTSSYVVPIKVSIANCTIENIQIQRTNAGGNMRCIEGTGNISNRTYNNLIAHQQDVSSTAAVDIFKTTSKIINSLIITESTSNAALYLRDAAKAYNCTIVSPSDVTNTGIGIATQYSNCVAKNSAVFGFNTDYSASGWDTTNSSHNASDSTGNPGGNSQDSKTFSSQFETVTTSGMDFRTKSGSDLVAGTRDATNTNDLDIVGQTRDTTTPTIGAWEFVAGGGSTGALTAGASLSEVFAAVATAAAALAEGVTLSETTSATAAATAGIVAGMSAGDSDTSLGAMTGSLAAGATLSEAQVALAVAVAAIEAGISAGEAWAADAQAVADLAAAVQFGDSYAGAADGASSGSVSEGVAASASFVAAVQALASLTEGLSVGDLFSSTSAANASIAAAKTLGATFTGSATSALTGAMAAGTTASDAFVAAVQALAGLTEGATLNEVMVAQASTSASIAAGVTLGASFSYGGTIGCLIAAITIAAALSASTTIDPAVDGTITICP